MLLSDGDKMNDKINQIGDLNKRISVVYDKIQNGQSEMLKKFNINIVDFNKDVLKDTTSTTKWLKIEIQPKRNTTTDYTDTLKKFILDNMTNREKIKYFVVCHSDIDNQMYWFHIRQYTEKDIKRMVTE